MRRPFYDLRTVTWSRNRVKMIDQTMLPTRLVYRTYDKPEGVASAIKKMVIRGAPAIGVAAAMGVALAAVKSPARTKSGLERDLFSAASLLRSTRPTAVNLFWGIDRVLSVASSEPSPSRTREAVVAEVKQMEEEDIAVNKRLGRFGAELLEDCDTVMTQCNAGALATVGYGTALGVVRAAVEQGKMIKVLVPETRPQLQGSRLTAFELKTDHIDCTILPDTAVGHLMALGRVDKVLVGADRITRDSYVFNKIGTYQVAALAKRHSIPFYPAAPYSSIDMSRTHDQIRIEDRPYDEVVKIRGRRIAPKGVPVANPAFDATPPELVTGIITDRGLVKRPLVAGLKAMIS